MENEIVELTKRLLLSGV